MRERKLWLVISFATTTQALAVEAAAAEDHISGRIIPLPQQISAGCGLAWKGVAGCRETMIDWLNERGLDWEAMHEVYL